MVIEEQEAAGRLPKEQPRLHWLFLDLNSYFASVEQELRPELRGRPVAVVPLMADTTCCIAASYEAKRFGIRTGTQVGEARRLCPEIVLIEGRHDLYVAYHHRIVEAVESCIPVTSVMSIDEMACRLIGREQNLLAALDLARAVKAAVARKAGVTLRCSVGLAPNRYLAKVASDMEKPDGLVALTPDLLPGALRGMALRDLPGIGARMEARLLERGIRNVEELLALDREGIHAAWGGKGGEKLWHWLRGEDFNDSELEHQKSIGHSHVLPPELRTPEGAHSVASKLLHKSAIRLRKARLWAAGMTVTVRFAVGRSENASRHSSGIHQKPWAQSIPLVECQDAQTLMEGFQQIWKKCPTGGQFNKPFFVGVTLGSLVPDPLHSLDLFSGLEETARRTRLTEAMDQVNDKYGFNTLYFASGLLAKAAAPTRIAFSSIPDLFEM